MDPSLKLAQLQNIYTFRGPNTRKFEIAREIDIDYCIPDVKSDDKEEKNYSGYNCLHIAALNCDADVLEYFLSKGADLCKKGSFDGCMPIHVVLNNYRSSQSKYYWELSGLLQQNEVVSSLLCAHMKREGALNLKSNSRLSHFHMACMFDHLEAVKYFLKIHEPVDQATNADSHWPGYTPLHFAVRYSSARVAETLLKHGADVNKGHAKDLSSLQMAIERLITLCDYMLMGKGILHSSCEEEVHRVDRLMSLMLETIEKDSGAIFVDKNGLTSLHIACIIKESSVLNSFLEMNSDLNVAVWSDSQCWPGWTPLHFAACTSYERFKLLVEHGAKIDVKNVKGETSLDLFMKRFSPGAVYTILSMKPELTNIIFSDNETKLEDVILAMNDTDRFDELLESLKNVDISVPLDSPIWPGYTVLHLAVSSNNQFLLREIFHKTTDLPKESLSSENQAGTENKKTRYWNIIQKCLTRGCKVTTTNANGDSPIHMAFKLLNKDLVLELLKYCKDDAINSDNLSIFHIACMLNDVALARHLLSKRSNVNLAVKNEFQWYEPESKLLKHTIKRMVTIKANSTALHTAVILDNKDICELLAVSNANFFARDSRGYTPLHLTIPTVETPKEASPRSLNIGFIAESAKEWMSSLLFSTLPDFLNWHTKDGLTYTHVAAFANNEKALQKLIKKGAKIHVLTSFPERFAGETPLHLAAHMGCPRAAKVLIEAGANIHAENPLKKYETPLLYAIDRLCLDTIKHFVGNKLKLKDRGIGCVDPSGLTLLHLACASVDFDWAKELLENGADANAQIRVDLNFKLAGFTPLHVVMTHVHVYARSEPESFQKIVELLLDHGADVTIESRRSGTPLHIASKSRFYGFRNTNLLNCSMTMYRYAVNSMLKRQKSYIINPLDKRGFSHFHLACVTNNVDVVEMFLQAGFDINHAYNYFEFYDGGYTGLHFAIQNHCYDTARLLIRRGADVKAATSRGETALHIAIVFKLNDMDLLKMLVHHGANINARNNMNDTPLVCLIEPGDFSLEKLRFFLSRKCSLDTMYTRGKIKQGFIGLALCGVAQADVTSTLELLIETCELQERIEKGFNAIHNVASIYNWDGKLTVDAYIKVFRRFIDMGCDVDQQDDGNTGLYAAVLLQNLAAIEALLRLGADISAIHDNPIPKEIAQQLQVRNNPRIIRIDDLLAAHVWKMKLVGFDLHPWNERKAEDVHKVRPMNPVVESAYRDKLTKMDEKMVGSSFIPKEFLMRKSLVVEYPTTSLVKKEAISNFFSDAGIIIPQYPEFSGLLFMKYRQIQNRMKMWPEAKSSLSILIPVELPDLCIEAVLQYMKNDEINIFISDIHKLKETVLLL